jgi:hypothetical protein
MPRAYSGLQEDHYKEVTQLEELAQVVVKFK